MAQAATEQERAENVSRLSRVNHDLRATAHAVSHWPRVTLHLYGGVRHVPYRVTKQSNVPFTALRLALATLGYRDFEFSQLAISN